MTNTLNEALLSAADVDAMPCDQAGLLTLHRQILELPRAWGPQEITTAAQIVSCLSARLEVDPNSDPRTVREVLVHVHEGLRGDRAQFDRADQWISHLRMQQRTREAAAIA